MNYKESKVILQKIKAAKKILINCHEHPDGDSVGGALALEAVLSSFNKEVVLVCPEALPEELHFLPGAKNVHKVDFSKFDYSPFDLFLILDTSSWDRVCGSKEIPLPLIQTIGIDHHTSNAKYCELDLLDFTKTSNSEILYNIFLDWKIEIDRNLAEYLLTGIISDTGSFQFRTPPETLELGAKLIKLGADKDKITFNLYKNVDFENHKVVGELLKNMHEDKKHKFIWSAVSYNFMKNYKIELNLDIVDILLQSTKDTDFGIRMIEKNPKDLRVSFRGRTEFDTSKIATALGGGGHSVASGAMVKGLKFEEAVKQVLKTARKYSKS